MARKLVNLFIRLFQHSLTDSIVQIPSLWAIRSFKAFFRLIIVNRVLLVLTRLAFNADNMKRDPDMFVNFLVEVDFDLKADC